MLNGVYRLCGAVALLAVASAAAKGSLISPGFLSIESNDMGEFFPSTAAVHMIDGSGLAIYAPTTLHNPILNSNPNPDNYWNSKKPTGTLVFDLGVVRFIDAVYIWNLNRGFPEGVRTLSIAASLQPTTGFVFTSLGPGPLTMTNTPFISAGASIAADSFVFSPIQARYVRLNILSNGGVSFTGLREVAFNEVHAVPEPSTLLVFIGLAFGLGVYGWRRKA